MDNYFLSRRVFLEDNQWLTRLQFALLKMDPPMFLAQLMGEFIYGMEINAHNQLVFTKEQFIASVLKKESSFHQRNH